jgi:hypothetical protein
MAGCLLDQRFPLNLTGCEIRGFDTFYEKFLRFVDLTTTQIKRSGLGGLN